MESWEYEVWLWYSEKIMWSIMRALDVQANLVVTRQTKLSKNPESKDPVLVAFQQNKLQSQKSAFLGVG